MTGVSVTFIQVTFVHATFVLVRITSEQEVQHILAVYVAILTKNQVYKTIFVMSDINALYIGFPLGWNQNSQTDINVFAKLI